MDRGMFSKFKKDDVDSSEMQSIADHVDDEQAEKQVVCHLLYPNIM